MPCPPPDAPDREPTARQSMQWRGSWAVQLWLDEPGTDAPFEVFKVSVAPGESLERSLEARPETRARVIVVSGPELEFRSRVEGAHAEPSAQNWTGTKRLDLTLPPEPGRLRLTIDTERSGQARIDFDVGGGAGVP